MSWKLNSSDFISDWIDLGVSKQKSIRRLSSTVCQEIMDKMSVEQRAEVFRAQTLLFGLRTGCTGADSPPFTPLEQRNKDHRSPPLCSAWSIIWHGHVDDQRLQRPDMAHAMWCSGSVWSDQQLTPMSFISQDFIAGATVSAGASSTFYTAERLRCRHTR